MNFTEFQENVIQWATERNFFGQGGATITGQLYKGMSEFGELCDNLAKGRDIRDDIGDNMVVAVVLSKLYAKPIVNMWAGPEFLEVSADRHPWEVRRIMGNLSYAWTTLMESDDWNFLKDIIYYCHELASVHNIPITECMEKAWNDIKDRKGQWRNGVFVKQADLDKEAGNV